MISLKSNTWTVQLTLLKGDPKGRPDWQTDLDITCACDTLERAVDLIRVEHPLAVIYGVTHRGVLQQLIDPVAALPPPK